MQQPVAGTSGQRKALCATFMTRTDEEVSCMNSMNEFHFFREDLCDRCGLCLERCPVLELPADEAKRELKKLIQGDTDLSLIHI